MFINNTTISIINNESQMHLIESLTKNPMTRVAMRKLGLDTKRSDLRYLERKGLINKTEEENSDGTKYFIYSLNS